MSIKTIKPKFQDRVVKGLEVTFMRDAVQFAQGRLRDGSVEISRGARKLGKMAKSR
ncbi:hypothetical protein [Alkalihalobacillus sp. AL-G]|uniref:hypothetical protein n=1 Tax=Alkalihalobacillus sp. AL-G TaxID=2926399 RepID=UPI0027297270|nr:hypothetical protein [Alkalihalobacillus sp. AL-G]WLD94456.1 hypothetical protein MOJ78_06085 [Alkalihalobacillus sp. AL-G]